MTTTASSRADVRRRTLSPRVVWIAAPLALVWVLVALQPLAPGDLWWHIAIGRHIVETGHIPNTNMYAYTIPAAAPYSYQGWLGEVVLYGTYSLGGLPLLALLRSALAAGSCGLLASIAWRRSHGNGPAVLLSVLAAALLGAGSRVLYAQSLALPLLAGLLLVVDGYLSRDYGRRALVALPLLMALWANLHHSFAVGLIILGAIALGALLALLRREPGHLARQQLTPLLVATLAALAATAASPLGLSSFSYAGRLLELPPLAEQVREWQPASISTSVEGMLLYMSLLAQPLLWRWRDRRPSWPHLLALLAVAWLAFSAWRSVVWYGMVLVPVLASALAPGGRPGPAQGSGPSRTLLLLVLLSMVAATLPWLRLTRLAPIAGRATQATALAYPELLAQQTPVRAVEALRRLRAAGHSGGKLFHELRFGSYLIWALPEEKVFIDPRIDLFSMELWEDYSDINELCGYDAILERYNVQRMLLDVRRQQPLIAALRQRTDWQLRYQDASAVIFVRR